MREIKFRGKRIYDGDWFFGNLVSITDSEMKVVKTYIHVRLSPVNFNGDSLSSTMCLHEVEPETVGQHTGLTDRNGKEIYEGDIVSIAANNEAKQANEYHWEWLSETMAIKYSFGGWRLYIPHKKMNFPMFFETPSLETEVIGNIYENPELLEVS